MGDLPPVKLSKSFAQFLNPCCAAITPCASASVISLVPNPTTLARSCSAVNALPNILLRLSMAWLSPWHAAMRLVASFSYCFVFGRCRASISCFNIAQLWNPYSWEPPIVHWLKLPAWIRTPALPQSHHRGVAVIIPWPASARQAERRSKLVQQNNPVGSALSCGLEAPVALRLTLSSP